MSCVCPTFASVRPRSPSAIQPNQILPVDTFSAWLRLHEAEIHLLYLEVGSSTDREIFEIDAVLVQMIWYLYSIFEVCLGLGAVCHRIEALLDAEMMRNSFIQGYKVPRLRLRFQTALPFFWIFISIATSLIRALYPKPLPSCCSKPRTAREFTEYNLLYTLSLCANHK